jgi:nickel transport system permease protein
LRGITEAYITRNHVLKNSFIPVVTAFGMHIGEIMGGAVVAEVIFAWPGVGRYAVSAIYNRDFPVMQCFILMMTVIFVLCNLITDIVCAALDPRIRAGQDGGM